jgi:AcrR family transcriptional regulator
MEAAMARRPRRTQGPQRENPDGDKSNREKIVEALLALLAEKSIEDIGLAEIAARAGVSLVEMRGEFGSVVAILAAHMKEVDRLVLGGGEGDMGEEPPRERLFDVLMRRLEVLAPHKAAVRSLMRSARSSPGLALALNGLAVRSMQWMLTAADINAAGSRGMIRAQGLAMLYAQVLRTWAREEDPGLPRTMAALDRALARGQGWSNLLEGLCRLSPARCCRPGRRRARRQRDEGEEETVAA